MGDYSRLISTGQRISDFIEAPVFIVNNGKGKYLIAFEESMNKEQNNGRYVRRTILPKILSDNASVSWGVQGLRKRKRRKVYQSHILGNESIVQAVGTDNYFRWLSEISGYCTGQQYT